MESKTAKKKGTRRRFSAQEKAVAVLSVWAERRKPQQVCREFQIHATIFSNWQNTAMVGMLEALEGKKEKGDRATPALGVKLGKLLDRKLSQRQEEQTKLQKRLAKIWPDPSPKESASEQNG